MSRLDELMLEWEARRERGEEVTPESLCPDDTEMRTTLAARIALVEKFNRYFLHSEDDLPGPEPAPPAPPTQIGGFVIEGELGVGGMGVVYKGFDPVLRRRAAIKTIRSDRLNVGPAEASSRFTSEGHALASLDHPNVVRVYEGGSHDGSPYLAMEFVPGGTVGKAREALRKKGPRAVVALIEKVARAVQAAHAQQPPIFHRDLKPSNILLTEKGEPKVADFGLAKLLDPEAPPPTDPVVLARMETTEVSTQATIGGGTPGYMAPEQCDPYRGRVSAATDVWALGVVLHELLTGRHPSADTAPDPEHVRTAVPGRVGRRLTAVVERCLELKPADRYQTAGELADALAASVARPRRVLWVVAAVALVGAAAAVAAGVDWEGRRFQARSAEVRARLERGETVAVVAAGHAPPLYRVRGERVRSLVQWKPDGLRVEDAGHGALVDLFTAPTGTPLRVDAVIRASGALSTKHAAGIFVTHETDRDAEKLGHHFDLVGFGEPNDQSHPSVSFLVQAHVRRPVGDAPSVDQLYQIGPSFLYPPTEFGSPREIAVSVRDSVRGWCGFVGSAAVPDKFGPIPDDDRWYFRNLLKTRHQVPTAGRVGPSVRVGVFARHCDVTVERLIVRLLNPGEE